MLQYLDHSEIDKNKWDACIKESRNSMPYGFSWFLDIVSPGWAAIITENYETVMPVPVGKKFGIPYIIQPFLTPQTGIFSSTSIDDELGNSFLNSIPSKYKYINLNLNKNNTFKISEDWIVYQRQNHYLDLTQSYDRISKNYSRRTHRNIKNALESGLIIKESNDASEFANFKALHSKPKLLSKQFKTMSMLVESCLGSGRGKITVVTSKDGDIESAAFYFIEKDHLVFLITVSSEKGKEKSAMHLILDHIIRIHCDQNLLMDFTGSSLKGVAYFNEGFGAKPEVYKNIVRNKLPFFLKFLKR